MRSRALTALAATTLALTGCGGTKPAAAPEVPLTIGLMVPLTGPYKVGAEEVIRGWQLYLDSHGGRLGGRQVKVVTVDEGEGGPTAAASAKKVIEQDKVVAIVGTNSAEATAVIAPQVTKAKIPFVGVGGRPTTLPDLSHVWHTSWLSAENGAAMAIHLRTAVDGPVFVIGPNYVGGHDQIGGFVQTFTERGGKLANPDGKPVFTPWPATTNFMPWLQTVEATGAKAVYTFMSGTPGVAFVKQYAALGLQAKIPLYASGFLTEGPLLVAEGTAATGIQTAMSYSATVDNPTNREFASKFQVKYNVLPNVFNVTAYDAAAILDRAIAGAGANPTGATINAALGKLGKIDSPRGSWQFGHNHTPIQPWYLRQVRLDGRTLTNVVVSELATLGR